MTKTEVQEKLKDKSVMICIPSIDGSIEMSCANSVTSAQRLMANEGVKNQLFQLKYDSLVTRARDMCVMNFLNSDFTHLMFIDSDIDFEPSAVLRLLVEEKSIIGAGYPKKEINWSKVERAVKAGVKPEALAMYATNTVISWPEMPAQFKLDTQKPIKISRLGTGFMLIERKVFTDMIEQIPLPLVKSGRGGPKGQDADSYEFFALSVDDTGLRLSEDYHFCDVARRLGHEVYAHPGIALGHTGRFRYTGDFARSLGAIMPEDIKDELKRESALMRKDELAFVLKHATGKKALCELGVARGATTGRLLSVADENAFLWAVDTFDEKNEMRCDAQIIKPSLEAAKESIAQYSRETQSVYLMVGTTQEVAKDIPEGLDFLLIDADHTGDAPANDFITYSPKVAKGGIILFHDADSKNKPVLEIVKFVKGSIDYEFIGQVASLAAFKKLT